MYYSLPVQSWRLTFDYQLIANPAYNRDRGPVSINRKHACARSFRPSPRLAR